MAVQLESLESRRDLYLSEYQAKQAYNQRLAQQVMAILDPVLEAEQTPDQERSQLNGILSGHTGRIQLSEASLKALFDAGLLHGYTSSTAQLDDPGWKHLDERATREHGRPFRYEGYFIVLPEGPITGNSVASVGLTLKVEGEYVGKVDFTRWVLRRDLV